MEIYTKIDKTTINGICDIMKKYILMMEISFISLNILFFVTIRYYLMSAVMLGLSVPADRTCDHQDLHGQTAARAQ